MTVELEPQIGSLKDEPAGADEMEVVEPDSEPNSEPNSEPDSDSESAPDPQSSMPTPPVIHAHTSKALRPGYPFIKNALEELRG